MPDPDKHWPGAYTHRSGRDPLRHREGEGRAAARSTASRVRPPRAVPPEDWAKGLGSHPPVPQPGSGTAIAECAEQAAHARTAGSVSCTRAHSCVRAEDGGPGDERPNSHRRTSAQDGHRTRGSDPRRVPVPPPHPQKSLREHSGGSPGPFLGPGGPAAAERPWRWLVQLPRAASPRASGALGRPVGRPLLGTEAFHGEPRQELAPLPQLCFLRRVTFLPVPQFPRLQNGDETASASVLRKHQWQAPSHGCKVFPAFLPGRGPRTWGSSAFFLAVPGPQGPAATQPRLAQDPSSGISSFLSCAGLSSPRDRGWAPHEQHLDSLSHNLLYILISDDSRFLHKELRLSYTPFQAGAALPSDCLLPPLPGTRGEAAGNLGEGLRSAYDVPGTVGVHPTHPGLV